MPKKLNEKAYQIKVTLKESKPLIWRRVQVPGSITFHRLHMILQYVMGWTNSHLYRFEIAGTEYSLPDPDGELQFLDSRRKRLNRVVSKEKTGFLYEYDFGDGWNHEIMVEKIFSAESAGRYPVCLAGKRACPPEDCSGLRGYADILKIIHNPSHHQYEEMMEWLGDDFDPEEFDIDGVNRSLARFRPKAKAVPSNVPEAFRRAFEPKD